MADDIKEIAGPTLTVELMALDATGRPQPTGQIRDADADAVVLALGQDDGQRLPARVPGCRRSGRTARSWSAAT